MLVIVALISTAIYFFVVETAQPTADKVVGKPSITLNDYLDNKLYAKHNNATWISMTELMYRDSAVSERSDLLSYLLTENLVARMIIYVLIKIVHLMLWQGIAKTFDVRTNESSLRPGFDHPAVQSSTTQELSPDKRYLLIGRDYQKVNANKSPNIFLVQFTNTITVGFSRFSDTVRWHAMKFWICKRTL